MTAARGNLLALKSGATSERQIRPLARAQKRRFLRQTGLRTSDLDPVGRAYLEHYVRLAAKVALIDAYLDEHGLIRADGEVQPVMRVYTSLHNSARLTLQRLEEHLARRGAGVDVASALAAIREEQA